jgi:hypothetical protein
VLLLAVALCGCGGGGGGGSPAPAPAPAPQSSGWVAGSFLPPATFAGQCIAPRNGVNPVTNQPYADVQGTLLSEENWLRSWSNDLYLWYDEIIDRDPRIYGLNGTASYFDLLKTLATTPSGNPKDKFHFTYATTEWLALSQSGVAAGYGVEWEVVASLPPRRIVAAYVVSNPALAQTVKRGDVVLTVDGVDVVSANTRAEVDRFVAALFPAQAGETHVFTLQNSQSGSVRSVTMQAANVTAKPVQNSKWIDTPSGRVGYVQFNDHLATAEAELVTAVDYLRSSQIVDLVLDLRYNGGGYLDIASELAYMIAGTVPTAGQTFENVRFNSKHPSIDPVTGEPLTPTPFHTTTLGFSTSPGAPLPTLNLPRVFVLTGPGTCSASESVINGLRGVNVEVIQIGSRTCGKPYGFYPAENCGTTYFSIQMVGVNAAGFGDYTDGFSPNNGSSGAGARLPGCSVADDFLHELGDPAEERLKAALAYRAGPSCPAPTGLSSPFSVTKTVSAAASSDADFAAAAVRKPRWREIRVLTPP